MAEGTPENLGPMTEETGRKIYAELCKLTAALEKAMPFLDNPAVKFARRAKGW